MTHEAAVLIVDALAVFRLTRLLVEDSIAQPIRGVFVRTSQWTMELITCPWCVSVWISAAVVSLQLLCPVAWFVVACWLAFSAIAGLLSKA